LPLQNEQIDREVDDILERHNARHVMHDAAVNGGDSRDAPETIRKFRGDGAERLHRNSQQAGEDIAQSLSRVESIEELDDELICAGVADEITKANRMRLSDVETTKSKEIHERHRRNRFMARLGIDRDVMKPNVALTILAIVAVFCAEFVLGTAFYLNVEADLLSAAMIAFVVSAALIFTALVTSLVFLRFAINGMPGSLSRRGAVVGSAIGLAFVFYLALIVAHDRDQLATFDPSQTFLRRLDWAILFHPWEWFHFEMPLYGLSFLLMLLGLSALSLWKGYSGIFDPIPGYNTRHEAWRKAANEANKQVHDIRQATYAPIERAQGDIDRVLGENRAALERARPLAQEADNREQQYHASADIVLAIINTAIRVAQDAYLVIRPERPSYFDQYLGAVDIPALPVTAAMVHTRIAALNDAVLENRKRGRAAKLALTALFETRQSELEKVLDSLEQLGSSKLRRDQRTDLDPMGASS
jgi:hypothetical protein